MEQLKRDYAELNRLWNRLGRGPLDRFAEEEVVRILSWLREELNLFNELRNKGIEGVSWGEVADIEKDVRNKEFNLRILNFSDGDFVSHRRP